MTAVVSTPPAAPEAEVAKDLVRRMLWLAPVFVAAGALGWGLEGALSSAFALGLVALNFAAAAALIGWGARTSQTALLVAVMGGYLVRLGAILLVLWLVKDLAWVEMVPLGITLVVAHLGLLVWESRYVSLSLAYPGLRPGAAPEEAD